MRVRFTQSANSIAELISGSAEALTHAGVPEARREAGSLLAHVLKSDRTYLIRHSDDLVDKQQIELFREFVQRRARGEPLQYITGVQDFFGLQFKVTPDVLIPRPETELVVEVALDILNNTSLSLPVICDVGTGSGCIAISLLHSVPALRAHSLDISPAAIEIAEHNATLNGVRDRISFVVSDCFKALQDDAWKFDLIVSNPPYVTAKAFSGLQREVRDYEPRVALSPGETGLEIISRLLGESPSYLKPLGHLLIEIGFDQGNAISAMINSDVWRVLDIHPDLQGIPRILSLQKVN